MTSIILKKKRADLVTEMGRIDAWLSDLVGKLKKVRTEKEKNNIFDQRRQRVDRKIEIQSEIRAINIQIQEENERKKEEVDLRKISEGELTNNEYLRLILEELKSINERLILK